MKYVIVTPEWCEAHGVKIPEQARMSLDGTKVILHEDFILPVIRSADEIAPMSYSHDSVALREILSSSEWTQTEDEA